MSPIASFDIHGRSRTFATNGLSTRHLLVPHAACSASLTRHARTGTQREPGRPEYDLDPVELLGAGHEVTRLDCRGCRDMSEEVERLDVADADGDSELGLHGVKPGAPTAAVEMAARGRPGTTGSDG